MPSISSVSRYFAQVQDVTRDQEATRKALPPCRRSSTSYPDSEYVADARQKVLATRDQLAGKEMQIGRYYLERREYVAAINRFEVVVTEYPDTRHVEEALERLVEANLAMGLVAEAQTAAAVLGHNFPDSQWYKDAYKLLQKQAADAAGKRRSRISEAAVATPDDLSWPSHARRPLHPRHRPDRSALTSISPKA